MGSFQFSAKADHNRKGGAFEKEQPKVGPKGTQAVRVTARETAKGSPLWGEKSGSERVNIGSRNERVKGHGEHGG